MESGDLLGNVCGGRGKCSFCGEMHNNVAYHEAWQCEKNKHSLKSPVTSVASRKPAPIAATETVLPTNEIDAQKFAACKAADPTFGLGSMDVDHGLNPQSLHPKSERRKFFEVENEELKRSLAAKTAELEEAKKWHVSNWTCVHHSDKEREDNKPCCPVCARRELVELRQRCEELDSDLEIIRRNIAGGAVSVMWVQKFIEDRRADRAKQALTQQEPRT